VGHKVFLILDNLKVHHGKLFKKWIADTREKIEVFYLPSYSPERNPDEYFNGTLKREIEKHGDCKSKEEFFKNAQRAAYSIQNNRRKVTNLFKTKKIAYASYATHFVRNDIQLGQDFASNEFHTSNCDNGD
jgi:hypothetical protein